MNLVGVLAALCLASAVVFGLAAFLLPADTHRRRGVRVLVLLFSVLMALCTAFGALVFHLLRLGS